MSAFPISSIFDTKLQYPALYLIGAAGVEDDDDAAIFLHFDRLGRMPATLLDIRCLLGGEVDLYRKGLAGDDAERIAQSLLNG